MYDCHIHSCYSGDSKMPVETACETAINNGLTGITFTDHLDFDYPGYDDDYFCIDFNQYLEYLKETHLKYANKLNVLKGIEVGIQPHVIDKTFKVVDSFEFDYVLASIHIVAGIDPYKECYFENKSRKEAYSRYLNEILFMVKNIANYDNIGHPEYVIRYATYDDRSLLYADHSDIFDEIFKKLIATGKGMELNTGSYKNFPNRITPPYDINVLKRYRELGGEIVTLASDAHLTQYVGYKFEEFRNLLLGAGFKYAAHFENRKPVFEKL